MEQLWPVRWPEVRWRLTFGFRACRVSKTCGFSPAGVATTCGDRRRRHGRGRCERASFTRGDDHCIRIFSPEDRSGGRGRRQIPAEGAVQRYPPVRAAVVHLQRHLRRAVCRGIRVCTGSGDRTIHRPSRLSRPGSPTQGTRAARRLVRGRQPRHLLLPIS